jgi:uncharacterized repeat protein (TIGR03803 family)
MRKKLLARVAVPVLVIVATVAAKAQFSVLYNFGTKSGDPYQPTYAGNIAQGRDGNLYTTADNGGANSYGAVLKITTAGTLSVLYSFDWVHGATPSGGVTLGTDGNFYGTTYDGGTSSLGTVFKITSNGTLTVLYNFTGGSDGSYPYAPPIQGTDGNWYGTTSMGGTSGEGTVYKLTPAGVFTTLYQFDNTHGGQPRDPLVQGTDGNLYGTALYGGTIGYGVIFKITTAGKLTVLYNFDNAHGGYPVSPLIQGNDGNYYGTAQDYGSGGGGVAFKITPTGTLAVLRNMNSGTDGEGPVGGLVQATDGYFYGVNGTLISGGNSGTLFQINSTGSSFSILNSFTGPNGAGPQVTPFQHTNGVIYGDTNTGGTGNIGCAVGSCGVFYEWSASLPAFAGLVSTSGKVGAKVGILGQNFSKSSVVTFGKAQAITVTLSGTTFITATVPSGATTASVTVTTTSGTLTSNKKFRVTPQITSFTPPSGPVGTVVTITGVSLTQASKVTFGGVAATIFTVNSDTQVTATVPSGAKTGKIAITTQGGTATSSGTFTVTPVITSFNPMSGPVGQVVTITGTSFTGATSVKFNGTSATFTVNSDSKATATVPSGATTGPITITTPGGTATSSTNFTVT